MHDGQYKVSANLRLQHFAHGRLQHSTATSANSIIVVKSSLNAYQKMARQWMTLTLTVVVCALCLFHSVSSDTDMDSLWVKIDVSHIPGADRDIIGEDVYVSTDLGTLRGKRRPADHLTGRTDTYTYCHHCLTTTDTGTLSHTLNDDLTLSHTLSVCWHHNRTY